MNDRLCALNIQMQEQIQSWFKGKVGADGKSEVALLSYKCVVFLTLVDR